MQWGMSYHITGLDAHASHFCRPTRNRGAGVTMSKKSKSNINQSGGQPTLHHEGIEVEPLN